MLENDQSFIYEKDEDEVKLMDRFNTEPNIRNSISSFLNSSDNLKENISSTTNLNLNSNNILNKEIISESQKNKDINNYNNNFNEPNISEKNFSRTIRKKNYVEEEGPKIISLDQVPLFRKLFISVHPFVLNGYRIHHTFKDCFFSMFKLHNETLNIWTHFLPFWGFLILAIHLFSSKIF